MKKESKQETINVSISKRKWNSEKIRTEAEKRGENTSDFVCDSIDSYILRDPVLNAVIVERSAHIPEWVTIERAAEEAIVNNLLERERCGSPLSPAEKTLLKKHGLGNDFLYEKSLSEVTAKRRLLALCNSKQITDAEYSAVNIAELAGFLRDVPTMQDEEIFLEFVKNLLLNPREDLAKRARWINEKK